MSEEQEKIRQKEITDDLTAAQEDFKGLTTGQAGMAQLLALKKISMLLEYILRELEK